MTESQWFIASSILFMVVFFFSRVVFMLMLNIRTYEANKIFNWDSQHPLVYFTIVLAEVLQVLLYLLQVKWFHVIFMNFYKTVTGGFKVVETKKGR